jgi:acetyl esterase
MFAGATSCGSSPDSAPQATTEPETEMKPMPIKFLKDIRYGPHERNVLDLWWVDSKNPAPLVLYIHGGGFRTGDKSSLHLGQLIDYLDAGFSVATLNYRLTNTAPAPAAYLDCGRALQFLRHHASKWNINPELVASTGSSAGAGISMWLGFHDDMADPKSEDPIARQSTRLTCIAVRNGQSSYDPRFAEKAGIPRPNFEEDSFFLPFYDITPEEINTAIAYQRYEAAAPITYVSSDDPPVLLDYTYPNDEVNVNTTSAHKVHHPKLGIALKEQLDALGIQCIVQYPVKAGEPLVRHGSDEPPVSVVDFIRQHFEAAKR